MKIFYSIELDAFYPEDYMSIYKASGNWPPDLVEVSKKDFENFGLTTPPDGKTREFINGVFSWKDVSFTLNQLKESEFIWVKTELERIRSELEKVQDSDPRAVGSVSQWREYRKSLRAWPERVEFPSEDFRPKAPDKE